LLKQTEIIPNADMDNSGGVDIIDLLILQKAIFEYNP